jgi:hypothetical protein
MEHKRKTETLVNRLRMPIDERHVVIDDFNAVSNMGLRMLAVKLDAIGEALAYIIEKKHAKIQTKKLRKQIKRSPLK